MQSQSKDINRFDQFLNKASLTLSAVFSPLLVPTYAFLLTMWLSVLAFVPEKARLMSAIMVFLFTTVVPLLIIIFMIRIGKISDSAISNRKQRTIPFIITTVCYIAAAIYLIRLHAPLWLAAFYFGAAAIAIISLVINLWWKISAHAGSMGGLCGALYFIDLNNLEVVPLTWWLIGAIVMSGAVCSARLYLGRHTLGQVIAGWLLGASVVTGMMFLI